MDRPERTDAPWTKLRPWLPPQKPRIGRPTKADRAPLPACDRAAHRERHAVERPINRLKQRRRLATRDEMRAATYGALVTIAAILLRR